MSACNTPSQLFEYKRRSTQFWVRSGNENLQADRFNKVTKLGSISSVFGFCIMYSNVEFVVCKTQIHQRMRLVIFYIFVIVNKSHEKTKTSHVLVCLSILSDLPYPACGTSNTYFHLLKRLYHLLNQLGTVSFGKCYSNRSKLCICWGLLSAMDLVL